ncbi:MAG TPA: hypothetical protein DDW27_18175 [Bacteroidales bacterium]|nr:hypothetical protein [Bacteroidales bacterium]
MAGLSIWEDLFRNNQIDHEQISCELNYLALEVSIYTRLGFASDLRCHDVATITEGIFQPLPEVSHGLVIKYRDNNPGGIFFQ